MSEDIQFKITADEAGAVNAFKRFRNEVLNNEKSLKEVGRQGKMTSTALKDAANILGPQFGILGDRIDHISGALADIKSASLIAKGSLLALVAVGSWEVGVMIGEWLAGTAEWAAQFEAATKNIADDMRYISKQNQERFDNEVKLAELASTQEQKNIELDTILLAKRNELADATKVLTRAQEDLNESLANDFMGRNMEDNAIAQEGVRIAKDHVDMLRQQVDQVDRLRMGRSELENQIAERQQINTEKDFIAKLKEELVQVKEGEAAYLRLTLAKQGFSKPTIDQAIELRDQIEKEKRREIEKQAPATRLVEERQQRAQALQADQQRFITRGIGMKGEDKLLAAAKEQANKSADLVAESKKQTRLLETRLPKEVIA